jgi:hypothetical protein
MRDLDNPVVSDFVRLFGVFGIMWQVEFFSFRFVGANDMEW